VDKRAAGQYLNKLYGKAEGHVSAAYKDKDESWQETQFSWPGDRDKLIAWADIHRDANVFVCPALRQGKNRVKGDALPTRWLWADVDWDKVPEDKYAAVQRRIAEIGTYVVASGSGENSHVYVQLDKAVPVAEHYRLNSGLRDYLYADAKHADNSLLRLPGTTNWKSEAGSPVRVKGGNSKPSAVAMLLKHREFRDVKVIDAVEETDWKVVDVGAYSPRILRMAQMPSAEAEAKYGNRHKAVWAITGELHKRGLDDDAIHTLMDAFPAAVEKNAEEHNGYNVHKDVDKRLMWDRANIKALAEDDDVSEDAGDVFEDVTLEEMEQSLIEEGVKKELLRRSIRRAADVAEAERGWVGPPDDVSWSLTDGLSNPPQPVPHLIAGLVGARHNVVLTAQYKTGKTAFTIGSIASSLADGNPFLDKFEVTSQKVVGHWNCEMDPAEMMDDYMRPVGIENTDNLHVANLRGYNLNIMTPLGKAWAVNWLTTRAVKVWTIDSFARLARMAGVSEKDNDEVMSLLMALDEIKVQADVEVLFLITHTGRAEMEAGSERARGATAIDDWADARWIMVKVDQVRTLRVEGRGVSLDETALMFDPETNRSIAGFGGREEIKNDGGVQTIIRLVKDNPGCTQTELFRLVKDKCSQRLARGFIEDAITGGFIEVKLASGGRGKPSQRHYLAGYDKPEEGATPRDVDMRAANRRRSNGR
jgi:hypothetical protein